MNSLKYHKNAAYIAYKPRKTPNGKDKYLIWDSFSPTDGKVCRVMFDDLPKDKPDLLVIGESLEEIKSICDFQSINRNLDLTDVKYKEASIYTAIDL